MSFENDQVVKEPDIVKQLITEGWKKTSRTENYTGTKITKVEVNFIREF